MAIDIQPAQAEPIAIAQQDRDFDAEIEDAEGRLDAAKIMMASANTLAKADVVIEHHSSPQSRSPRSTQIYLRTTEGEVVWIPAKEIPDYDGKVTPKLREALCERVLARRVRRADKRFEDVLMCQQEIADLMKEKQDGRN